MTEDHRLDIFDFWSEATILNFHWTSTDTHGVIDGLIVAVLVGLVAVTANRTKIRRYFERCKGAVVIVPGAREDNDWQFTTTAGKPTTLLVLRMTGTNVTQNIVSLTRAQLLGVERILVTEPNGANRLAPDRPTRVETMFPLPERPPQFQEGQDFTGTVKVWDSLGHCYKVKCRFRSLVPPK